MRRTVSAVHPRPICPLLEEGAVLPPGLTDDQRLCLTQGRLAADYSADLLIEKRSIAKSYGMGISLIAEEQPKMMQAGTLGEVKQQSFLTTVKAKASKVIEKVKKIWKS